jgi:F0F1-type ATP synthase membrane subunit b/b'
LCALVPFAVAAASGGEGEAHKGSILDLGKFWMNFAVYVTLLVVLLKKPVKSGWNSRRARIADSVSSATSDLAEAERGLAAVEALTKNLVVEQERARGEILSQGELEVQAIARAAVEKSARTKSQVKELLEGETRSAEAQFRSSLIAQAVELSKDRFKSGDYAARQSAYVEAAADRAKRLVG